MKGKHHIIVQNGNLKYEFDIKRNLTLLKGDSATGKTTLVEMIQEYLVNGMDSGVSLHCDVPCKVLTGNLWKEQLEHMEHSIVFIDEGNRFISSKEFAKAISKSSNYYVIITRESLETLPISVDEIYGIKSSGKYGGLSPVYHQFYKIYDFGKNEKLPIKPEQIIVEDSNAGYDFFCTIVKENCCISSNGKSNIFQLLSSRKTTDETLIVADGAAFGSQMNRIEHIIKKNANLHLYLPECFEWIILNSGVIVQRQLTEILEAPEKYIDSEKYISWERYFTNLLMEITHDTYMNYQKSKLNPVYLHEKNRETILESLKNILSLC